MKLKPENPRLLLRELLRQDYGAFLRKAYSTIRGGEPLVWNWHLDAIVHQLERIERGENLRELITIAPRSLKTTAISVAWVAYMLGRDPKRNFVCVSYGTDLSGKFGRECLAIMQSHWYREVFPNTIISSKRSASHDFETTRGGGRLSTSITGTLTGRGGDIIIIDDPIKPDDVFSEVARESVNTWYRTTLSSRLNDKASGAILVVMQRLHENDLAGTLLATGGWHNLKLQAIATEDQFIPLTRKRVYHRRKGELLHPARENQETIDKQRREMGSTAFVAQYQQDPLPALGNVIRAAWLKTYSASFDPHREPGQIVLSFDTASKEGTRNDFSVGVVAHVHRGTVRVIDVFRQRLIFPDLKHHAIRLAREHRAAVVLIEDQASGTALIQALESEKPLGVPPPIGIRPTGDKASRMQGVSGQVEAGQLLLPEDAHWLHEFKAELLGFPNAHHDDQCDALSQLMNWVQLREAWNQPSPLAGPILFTAHDDGSIEQIGGDDDDQVRGYDPTYGRLSYDDEYGDRWDA